MAWGLRPQRLRGQNCRTLRLANRHRSCPVRHGSPGFATSACRRTASSRRRSGRGFSYRRRRQSARDAISTRSGASARWRSRRRGRTCGSAPTPNGHVQAIGRDARGRKQYRYHARWRETRDENKYARMLAFARVLPRIRAQVERDLARPGLPREKVLATLVRLLETTLIRVGNEEYARANGSFGLTTLRDRHVDVNGVAGALRVPRQGRQGARDRRARPADGPHRAPVAKTCPARRCSSTWTRTASAGRSTRPTSTPTWSRSPARTSPPRTSARGPARCWRRGRWTRCARSPARARPSATSCARSSGWPRGWATRRPSVAGVRPPGGAAGLPRRRHHRGAQGAYRRHAEQRERRRSILRKAWSSGSCSSGRRKSRGARSPPRSPLTPTSQLGSPLRLGLRSCLGPPVRYRVGGEAAGAPGGANVRSSVTASPFLIWRRASGPTLISKESRCVLIFTSPSLSTSVTVP